MGESLPNALDLASLRPAWPAARWLLSLETGNPVSTWVVSLLLCQARLDAIREALGIEHPHARRDARVDLYGLPT